MGENSTKNKKMKILALNLPAFHQIPENDEWWGEGFTEWTNVKSGVKQYSGHYQPIEPYNDNYYNLSKIEDIENQMKLAEEYGIYGFVFYHYWFGNGRMLFEKPAEMILNESDKSISFHYCFCWANQSWYTSWHGLKPKTLLEQLYPGKEDWEEHLKYLLQFFKDERYIKVDNKPMLVIYNAEEIPDYDEMADYLEQRLIEEGFGGIYLVEYIFSKTKDLFSNKSSAVTEFEPLYTCYFDISKINLFKRFVCKKLKCIDYQNYDRLWKYIIKRKRTYHGKTIIKGCFSGWDNSARKGKESMIVKMRTPESFEKNFKMFLENNRKDESEDFCIINAWNEWSEGAYLEPDSKYQYGWLNAVKNVIDEYNKRG